MHHAPPFTDLALVTPLKVSAVAYNVYFLSIDTRHGGEEPVSSPDTPRKNVMLCAPETPCYNEKKSFDSKQYEGLMITGLCEGRAPTGPPFRAAILLQGCVRAGPRQGHHSERHSSYRAV